MFKSSSPNIVFKLRQWLLLLIPIASVLLFSFAVKAAQKTNPVSGFANTALLTEEYDDTTALPPLYIVDGKEMPASRAAAIDASAIASVNVIKDDAAVSQYGDKAKHGVIIITLKTRAASSPLYYVNGKEMSKKEVDQINPGRIASMSVWKGEEAKKKWGNKGENGVVEIKLKPTH